MKDRGFGRSVALVLATSLALGLSNGGVAEAQEVPRYELSAGYAYLRDHDLETSFPLGWDSSLAWNLTRSLGVVADSGGNYKSKAGTTLSIHAFLAGARYSFRGERITPYVEGLAGVARATVSSGGDSESGSDFAVQAGAGVAVRVDERFSLRGGVDFRNIFSEGTSLQEFRIVAGVSFGFGGSREATTVTPPPAVPPPFEPPRAEPPPPSPALPPASTPAPAVPTPAAPPAGQPARPAPRPQAPSTQPPAAAPAAGSLARARELLSAGSYAQAADAFRADLPGQAANMFTIPVGVYCDASNVAALVKSADAQQLVLVRLTLRGRECFGLYFGLFASAGEARAAVAQLPAALRAPGQAPVSIARVLSRAR